MYKGDFLSESFSEYEIAESFYEIEESFIEYESECTIVGEETGVRWVHYNIHYFLEKLNDLYTDWSAASPLKGQLKTLHQELRFAKTYVRYLGLCEQSLSFNEQTADIRGQLIFLLRFSINLPDDCLGDLKLITADITAVAWEAANFKCKFCATEGKEDKNKQMNASCGVAWFLEKIRLIKAEIFLMQLLDSKDTLMVLMKDEIAALHEGLKFLGTILADPPKEHIEDIKLFLTRLQKVSSAISYLVQDIHDQKITKEMLKKINLDLFWLLENIKLIKAETNIMELQKSDAKLLVHQKDKIDALLDGVRSWRAVFMDATDIDESTEDGKLYMTYLQAVIGVIASQFIISFQ